MQGHCIWLASFETHFVAWKIYYNLAYLSWILTSSCCHSSRISSLRSEDQYRDLKISTGTVVYWRTSGWIIIKDAPRSEPVRMLYHHIDKWPICSCDLQETFTSVLCILLALVLGCLQKKIVSTTPNTSEIKPVWVMFQTGLHAVEACLDRFEFGAWKQVALFKLVWVFSKPVCVFSNWFKT